MRRKIAATYVYNIETDTFTEYRDLTWERISFDQHFDGVKDHCYAIDYKKHLRIEIAKHSGDIFHNRLKHEYIVYLNSPDKVHATHLLSDYIITRTEIEMSYHEKQLYKLKDRRNQVANFRDKFFPKI